LLPGLALNSRRHVDPASRALLAGPESQQVLASIDWPLPIATPELNQAQTLAMAAASSMQVASPGAAAKPEAQSIALNLVPMLAPKQQPSQRQPAQRCRHRSTSAPVQQNAASSASQKPGGRG
jgi:hypothetical protein